MTKLKFTLTLNDSCTLSIKDTTGYVDTNNLDGFIAQTTPTIPVDSYKISNGYFMNVILYNKYGAVPIIVNPKELYLGIPSPDPVYENNFPLKEYSLSQDGVFSIKRIFVISKVFYDAEKTTSRFNGKKIYYSDGESLFKIVSEDPEATIPVYVEKPATVLEYVLETVPVVGTSTEIKIVSTCFINKCYVNILNVLIKKGLDVCDDKKSAELIKQRDFLYMVLEVIKYYKEFNNIVEIQKMIEKTTTCDGICKEVSTANDCGCNG